MGFGSSGSGSGSIASSSDVTFNNVVDSQLLAYDGTTAKWKNKTATPALPRVVALTYTSTLSPNADTSDIATITLAGNPTINAPLGTVTDGQKIEMHLKQDATGSRTVTWASNYSFATGLPAPTLSTAANATDILGFRYSAASSKWRFYGIINGF
jgi:hypothetical protein